MMINLTNRLIIILGCGLLLAFAGQVATRYFFELPALRLLEDRQDAKDVERVRLAFSQIKSTLAGNTVDYAAWNDAYEAISHDRGDPAYDRYVDNNLVHSTYENLDIDGSLFIDAAGTVKHSNRLPKISDRYGATVQLEYRGLRRHLLTAMDSPAGEALIGAGLVDSNLGPVMFAASHIVTSEPPYLPSRGTLVFWRLLDEDFFSLLAENVQTRLTFIPLAEVQRNAVYGRVLNNLENSGRGHLPRDPQGHLYWILRDLHEKPLLLVRQESEVRAFSGDLVSTSVLVGFAASALVLLIVIIFFSHTVIRRLLSAKDTMLQIINTGEYDRRLESHDKDEIDTMFSQFNRLLGHIQMQKKELEEQNRALAQLSEQDALTGIANRRYLDEVLDRSWRQCARSGNMLSVLMIDVDYFKPFNDKYGHPAGDHVLKMIAQTLQHNLHRATDYLARYGGEEFCVVLTDTSPEAAVSVAERLRSEIKKLRIKNEVSKCADVVTVSIGIATVAPDAGVVEMDIVKSADEALYEAKKWGRNCVFLKDREQPAGETMQKSG